MGVMTSGTKEVQHVQQTGVFEQLLPDYPIKTKQKMKLCTILFVELLQFMSAPVIPQNSNELANNKFINPNTISSRKKKFTHSDNQICYYYYYSQEGGPNT